VKRLLGALLLLAVAATPAAAADNIALDQPSPALGDYVTFTTSNAHNPRIEVLCYQDGVLVFGMAGDADYGFLLGGAGSDWLRNGGPADCIANLYYFSWRKGVQYYTPLATTSFAAGG
jgi:opacity protein-like surface antigen